MREIILKDVKIKKIRLQLGWSRVQLADYLECSVLDVLKMEENESVLQSLLNQKEKVKVEALQLQVLDVVSNRKKQQEAEIVMNENGMEQIHIDELK